MYSILMMQFLLNQVILSRGGTCIQGARRWSGLSCRDKFTLRFDSFPFGSVYFVCDLLLPF